MSDENSNNIYIANLGVGILASEKSRRMQANKALLKFGNKTFLEHLCDELRTVGDIIIAAGQVGSYKDMPYKIVYDAHHGVGPMEGIYQILKHSKHKYNFVCSVDMPYFKKELAFYLSKFVDGKHASYIFRDEKRVHPTCAIYSTELTPLLEQLIDDKQYCLLEIYKNSKTKYVDFPYDKFDKEIITNINTLEDYNKLVKC